jgi:maltooligosyltrehalose synthase
LDLADERTAENNPAVHCWAIVSRPLFQGLGVNTLYLNPIFAARSNHRYDTDDYMHVDA